MSKGYIYIMTNPMLHGPKGEPVVKIGYADDVEKRRKQLSTTNVPASYRVYATYTVNERLTDQMLHKMIDKLNPNLRIKEAGKNGKDIVREFYYMEPEEAKDILETIATISGTKGRLKMWKPTKEEKKEDEVIASHFNFSMVNLNVGDTITFLNHDDVKCKVYDNKRVEYNGEVYSLSVLGMKLLEELEGKKWKSIQGPAYFCYKGRKLSDIRKEMSK